MLRVYIYIYIVYLSFFTGYKVLQTSKAAILVQSVLVTFWSLFVVKNFDIGHNKIGILLNKVDINGNVDTKCIRHKTNMIWHDQI